MTTALEERNIRSVHEQVACLNAHDIDGFLRFLAPDFVWRSDLIPVEHRGIEAAREGLAQIFAVFPDIHFEELALYPGGEVVTGVFEVTGTEIQPGPGSLLPPIHDHPWHMNQAIIHVFDQQGKMKMVWLFANVAYLLQQLGAVPSDLSSFGSASSPGTGHGAGAMGTDPWNPAGSPAWSSPAFGPLSASSDPEYGAGYFPDSGSSILGGLLGLPLRLLHGLLVVLEAGLGIETDDTWPDPGYAHGGAGCPGCGDL
ncbi:MAG: nuclear transport factor 2 family protein [Holophagales bacterium]|nr:nuclear transport factor 2 family protein [Holophagales bacterium]